MKIQNETQSMHWRSQQVLILVHIAYRLNPNWSNENNEPLLLKEVHYYVSDDKVHDSLYVQHCFLMHWNFMKDLGFTPKNHIVWSDGCSGQFKSARVWYFISRYPSLTVTDGVLSEDVNCCGIILRLAMEKGRWMVQVPFAKGKCVKSSSKLEGGPSKMQSRWCVF